MGVKDKVTEAIVVAVQVVDVVVVDRLMLIMTSFVARIVGGTNILVKHVGI